MSITRKLCFLCYEDGYDRKAIANYLADDGEFYDVCKKHLEFVKKAKLPYTLLKRSFWKNEN